MNSSRDPLPIPAPATESGQSPRQGGHQRARQPINTYPEVFERAACKDTHADSVIKANAPGFKHRRAQARRGGKPNDSEADSVHLHHVRAHAIEALTP